MMMMTRHLCVILSVATVASVNPAAAPPEQRSPDFSGTYSLLPDRSVAITQASPEASHPPASTSGRTVAGACGDRFIIAQTDTLLTVSVVSGETAARRYSGPPVDGRYDLEHSTIVSSGGHRVGARQTSFKRVAIVSRRGASLELTLTDYRGGTRFGRTEYLFRFDKDNTLTVRYLTHSSAYEIVHNSPYLTVTSVYRKSVP